MLPGSGNHMTQIKVTREWRDCEECNGEGEIYGVKCPVCEGERGHYEEIWR